MPAMAAGTDKGSDSGSGDAPAGSPRSFQTTRWSLVATAGDPDQPEARAALATLCQLYWYPIYLFVRRRGYNAEQALDLTQGFFTRILEKNDLAMADPRRGRFRSWLLGCLKHYLSNELDKAKAQKRGGGKTIIRIDATEAEDRYWREPAHDLTPERVFDRRWALTVLEQAMNELKDECALNGKGELFDALRPSLAGEGQETTYSQIGQRLEMSEGAVKVAAHRLRARYRDILRGHIAETVDNEQAVDEEIKDLFAAVG